MRRRAVGASTRSTIAPPRAPPRTFENVRAHIRRIKAQGSITVLDALAEQLVLWHSLDGSAQGATHQPQARPNKHIRSAWGLPHAWRCLRYTSPLPRHCSTLSTHQRTKITCSSVHVQLRVARVAQQGDGEAAAGVRVGAMREVRVTHAGSALMCDIAVAGPSTVCTGYASTARACPALAHGARTSLAQRLTALGDGTDVRSHFGV